MDLDILFTHFIHNLDLHAIQLLIEANDLVLNTGNPFIEPVVLLANAKQLALHARGEAVECHPVSFTLVFHGDSRTSSSPA